MPVKDNNDATPYPVPPPGVSRMEDLATVEAGIRYWEAARLRAAGANDHQLERTATSLKLSYEAARQALIIAQKPGVRRRLNPES
jgi:hypothetical protein